MQWAPEHTVTRVISISHCIPNPVHTGLSIGRSVLFRYELYDNIEVPLIAPLAGIAA